MSDLAKRLRQYADVAEAGGKPHWANAMREAMYTLAVYRDNGKAMGRPVIMPPKPSHRLIRELAGNPVIVPASYELDIRRSYALIRKALIKLAKEKP